MSDNKFHAHSTALEVVKGHDLTGFEAIVTGGASGIGVETVRALATAGANVVIATRDLVKAEGVAEQLRKETGKEHISAEKLELGSLASVDAFVKKYLASGRKLNILINNAGIMACPKGTTEDGIELQFGTNHIGHFALATGLVPALKAAAEATGKKSRVVSLSSLGHIIGDVLYDDYNFEKMPYNEWLAYGQSKSANALFAVGFTKRFASEGVVCNAVMPGGIMTGLQKNIPREEQIQRGWIDEQGNIKQGMKTPEEGASTSIWAALAPELEGKGGLYLEDCAIAEAMPNADEILKAMMSMLPKADEPTAGKEEPVESVKELKRMKGYFPRVLDEANADRLWEISEKIVNKA